MRKSAAKLLAFFMVIMLTVVSVPVTVLAETTVSVSDYNAQVLEKKQSLEKKYGISINYPQSETSYAGIGIPTLITLDTCLSYVTPEIISQISEYCVSTNDKKLTISYSHSPDFELNAVAAFSPSRSLIQIYSPRSSNKKDLSTGSAPLYIVHEVGHAYYEFLASIIGENELRQQWTALNGGASYGSVQSGKNVFVTEYAATDYREDFADTFGYAFVCNRAGLSIAKQLKTASGGLTPLGEKVEFIKKMISKHSPNSTEAITNIDKAYKTPDQLDYRGLILSGSALQYIGYNEPYGIVKAVTASLPFDVAITQWDKTVGGWIVTSNTGKEYLAFPSGIYTDL